MIKIDPITLEVMRNAFQSVAEEMGAALIRTALSPNIKDRRDCSTGVYSADGDLIAQAEHIPLHLGLMPSVVKSSLIIFPVSSLQPGDAIITNDPYVSGSHLPDVCIISPFFHEGRCIGILANLAHHVDIGGMTPGGMPTISTEIFQEGLRIPPIRIQKGGFVDKEILSLITTNVRTHREAAGDIQAQIAANNVGERRLLEIMQKYGLEKTLTYMEELIVYSERQMLARIKELPKGTFTFEDYLEGDGLSDEFLRIKADVSIADDKIIVDFSGSAGQTKGSVNCTRAVTLACTFYALKAVIDPDLPSTGGTFRPVEVITPGHSIVNPDFPRQSPTPTSTRPSVSPTWCWARWPKQCLSECRQPLPVPCVFLPSGVSTRVADDITRMSKLTGGGQGAVFNQDGMDGIHTNMTNTRNTPVEVIEIAYPLLVNRYGLVPDTDGPGQFRGGLGFRRKRFVVNHTPTMSLGSDRLKLKPWGLMGGGSGGSVASLIITPDREEIPLPSKTTREITSASRVILKTAGGGGYGNPFDRPPEKVLEDVKEHFIGIDRAKSDYGVVIDSQTMTVDLGATEALKRKHRSSKATRH